MHVTRFLCPIRYEIDLSVGAEHRCIPGSCMGGCVRESVNGRLAQGMGIHAVVFPALPQKRYGTSSGDVTSPHLPFPIS